MGRVVARGRAGAYTGLPVWENHVADHRRRHAHGRKSAPLEEAIGRRRVHSFTDTDTDASETENLRLAEFISPGVVKIALAGTDQWTVVEELIDLLVEAGEVPEKLARASLRAAKEREAIRPTGWKYGLALPNGRVKGLRRIVAAVGVSQGGVDFGCRDGLPARIVVLLLFPEARYARFAPAINDIADTLEDPALREAILTARRGGDVVEAIEDAETRDFS